jgi:hypothetical protein
MNSESTQRARVKVSFGRKYSVAQYESLDIFIGAEDDCEHDESVVEGLERLTTWVQDSFEELCAKVEGQKKGAKK